MEKCDFTECSLYIFRFGKNPHRIGIGKRMDEIKQVFCKRINKTKSKNYPIPQYGINGKLIGYEESDEHFRNRVLKAIEGNKE